MNLLNMVFGSGARCKRARRGREKNWNQYDDSARIIMEHGDSMKRSPRWLEYKRKKQEPAPDHESD